jgi:diaminohydroxyphosphoribosylaminopyrimidine deaminase/5-amino-6-(5-phosphoribosylamino)uracil reductase
VFVYSPKTASGFFVQTELDDKFMALALHSASNGRGRTSPNPMVGAAIAHGSKVIAEGYHSEHGSDHAEIVALHKAGRKAKGATLYVTLEPCCHIGRTGPCTDAIIASGIKRVVYACTDPDPRVNGRGARILKDAGLEVVRGVLQKYAQALNEPHFHFHRTGRPFVTLKLAQSIDGRIATATGDSKWISGPDALTYAHQLRAESDAVVIGMGTLVNDNPSLTVRRVKGNNPYRIVLSSSLSFPRKCQLIDHNDDFRTIVASTDSSIQRFARSKRGRSLIYWSIKRERNGHLDLSDLLEKSARFGLKSILVEGGAKIATSFLKTGLVDKYIAIISPTVIGAGTDGINDLGVKALKDAISLRHSYTEQLGQDCLIIGYPEKGK